MTKTPNKAPTASSPAQQSKNAREGKVERTAAAETRAISPNAPPKTRSKRQQVAALIVRDEGATLEQMIAATGWLPHTTRAALTGLKKNGYVISSDKVAGVRTYRAIAPE